MIVTKYFLIGNMSVPSTWIATVLAFFIAYGAVRLKYGKQPSLLLADAIFNFVIVWKLSVIVTDWKTVIQFPLSILYFNGGKIGVFLGLLAASITVVVEMKKGQLKRETIMGLLFGSILIQSSYQILMAVLNDGPIFTWLLTVSIIGAFVLFILFFMDRFKDLLNQIIFLFISVHLFVGVLQPGGLFQTPVIATVYTGIFLSVMLKFYVKPIKVEGVSH
ncbi:hypothetical protein [Sporosarcina pasteurii]|uniref:Uncharacterized protein n=1 Tax=Sporosarcina pasteurii TaxID=1474 RepID=A0A380BG78_SPOPA|nr:hypothetical protein [Sporosarcina pasteurii]MDS9470344.1 hypothetical protein [Sporosarcina pasteurii]QBQ05945.1 hypothetical protein E2C16_09810 [Sporosarcina pasteurii]SUI99843.1 Uncharacterised protein [Sporosarcina pasteurii]